MVLPNGQTIVSTGSGKVQLPANISVQAHIFADSELQYNLLPLSHLCNEGCTATLTATDIAVTREGTMVLQGSKDRTDALWTMELPPGSPTAEKDGLADVRTHESPTGRVNLVVHNQLDLEYVAWACAVFSCSPISTMLRALRRGWLSNFPRLTGKMLAANPPAFEATAMGHLDRIRQGINSTKAQSSTTPQLADVDYEDEADPEAEDREVFFKIVPASDVLHSDATGRMPVQSKRGTLYILVSCYNNYVHLEPMTARSKGEYARAFSATHTFFRKCGANPMTQRLDNETSKLALAELDKHVANVDLVPPGNHRANLAERAIRDAKNHIIAMRCGVDKEFPADELDRLFEQAELTLNMLRPCTSRPDISAYEGVHGKKYDWLAHPMAPPGTRVVILETPDTRASWADHGQRGFYLGPALNTYRSFRTLVSSTGRERVSDSLAWFPTRVRMPGSSIEELMVAAMRDLCDLNERLLKSPAHMASSRQPFEQRTRAVVAALRDVASLYEGGSDPSVETAFAASPQKPNQPQLHNFEHPAVIKTPSSLETQERGAESVKQRVLPVVQQDLVAAKQPAPQAMSAPTAAEQRGPNAPVTAPPIPRSRGKKVRRQKVPKVTPTKKAAEQRVSETTLRDKTDDNLEPPPGFDFMGPAPHANTPNQHIVKPLNPAVPQKAMPTALSKPMGGMVTRAATKSSGAAFSAIAATEPAIIAPRVFNAEHAASNRTKKTPRIPKGKVAWSSYYDQAKRQHGERVAAGKPRHRPWFTRSLTHAHSRRAGWAGAATAKMTEEGVPTPALNLTEEGVPLTYKLVQAGPDRALWVKEDVKEFDKLIEETRTMHPIQPNEVPEGRRGDATYYNPQPSEKMKEGKKTRRIRGVCGGDHIKYTGDVSARTAEMSEVKTMLNAVVSEGAHWMTLDITDFYLGTPMDRPEYMRVPVRMIPEETMIKYGLDKFVHNGVVLFQIDKGMYGLPQAGLLAQQRLVSHLSEHGSKLHTTHAPFDIERNR